MFPCGTKLRIKGSFSLIATFLVLNLGASFAGRAQNYQLEVWTHFGAGLNGTITVEPGDHTASSGFYDYYYSAGTPVSVLALAPSGATFNGWYNCFGSFLSGNPAYGLTLNGNQCVQAYFVSSSGPYVLTVYKGAPGLGNGVVSGTGGFYCGPSAGSASQSGIASGTVVWLTNNPSPGWFFAYWETNGVIVSNSSPLRVVMDRDQLVQAIFVHSNIPPVVNIVSSTNNAFVSVCSKTPVTVEASDSDGSITNVELYINSVLVAQKGSSPLIYTITNEALLITNVCVAKAIDNSGASVVSGVVNFIVQPPGTNVLQVLGSVPTNSFEFCLCGLSNRVYAVQTSTNLLNHWEAWRTVTNDLSGVTAIIDRGAITNRVKRFYRAGLATSLARYSDSINSNNPAVGGIVTINGTVTNSSCSGVSVPAGAFHVGFYGLTPSADGLTTVAPFYEKVVPGCAANGIVSFSVNISINAQTPPGTYYLGYSINDENEVPDCDFSNIGAIWYWTLNVH